MTTDKTFTDDGLDCTAIEDSGLLDVLSKCSKLEYQLRHCTRSSANFGDTLQDLADFVTELSEELADASSTIAE